MIIDTFQIECFLSVAEHLNFTIAANNLFISQPAISRKVATLEKELGVILVDRTSRELKLTKEGEYYQAFFLTFIKQLSELSAKTRRQEGILVEEVNVGIFEGWNLSGFLMSLKKSFSVQFQNAVLNIDTCSEKSLIQGLKEGRYDVILLLKISIRSAINAGYINHVSIHDVMKVHKAVCFSVYNPLASLPSVKFEDFNNQVLYTFKSGIVPEYIISNMDLLKKYKLEPKIKVLSTLDAVINAISTDSGFALFDELTRISDNREFQCLLLEETHSICVVSSEQNQRQTVQWLMNYCKNRALKNI